ncbi:hypothetical protein ABTM99_19270, partial [Acinetobacter baumannii]
MAAAARVPGIDVMLVERDPEAVDLARANLTRPANSRFAGRCRVVEADITEPMKTREVAGLGREIAAHVLINPPYYVPRNVRSSPSQQRA